jgi:hypothetical protein
MSRPYATQAQAAPFKARPRQDNRKNVQAPDSRYQLSEASRETRRRLQILLAVFRLGALER